MAMDPTQIQLAQLTHILGPDLSQFETLISHLMASSNHHRSQAESCFLLAKETQPDSVSLALSRVISSSPRPELRALSAVLLRKILTPAADSSFLFPLLAETTRDSIKSALLFSLQTEQSKTNIKKVCDTISEIASSIPSAGWPDLLPFLFECVNSINSNHQESGLLIFSRLAHGETTETLIPHFNILHSVLLKYLSSPLSDVRVAALRASISFIKCMSSGQNRDAFQELLPFIMKTLTESLNSRLEATAEEVLKLLIELADTEPEFLMSKEVLGLMFKIAEAKSLEEGSRHLAVEFLITLAESKTPGMMVILPQFVRNLFWLLINLLVNIEDDADWYNAENEVDDDGETSIAQECMYRMSISLGGDIVIPLALKVFPVFLSSVQWQKRYAVLITLSQIENCSKVMIGDVVESVILHTLRSDLHPRVRWAAIFAIVELSKSSSDQVLRGPKFKRPPDSRNPRVAAILNKLEEVVLMLLDCFHDSHTRVRWAAIKAIGHLSVHLSPNFQKECLHLSLPALAVVMEDVRSSQEQVLAASAILNFIDYGGPKCRDIIRYYRGLLSKFRALLRVCSRDDITKQLYLDPDVTHTSSRVILDAAMGKCRLLLP